MDLMRIPLGRGYEALVDAEDYAAVSAYRWRALVQGQAPNLRVYAVTGYATRMHRLIWQRAYGPLAPHQEIDHVEHGDHGGLDNRRSNLRLTTKSLNQANSRRGRNNTSGFKGVWWQKQVGRWRADILVSRRKVHLGYFSDKEQAARAYDAAALSYFGEHACVNFPVGRTA